MSESKLSVDWIVVNSKSHPGRVYYFNMKTKQSMWTEPAADKSKQESQKTKQCKRKKNLRSFSTIRDSQPVTPENNYEEKQQPEEESVLAKQDHSAICKQPKEEKETPQMIALREKIAKKKKHHSCSKKEKKLLKAKLQKSEPTKTKSNDDTKPDDPKCKLSLSPQNLTPQMKVIYEKIHQRTAKDNSCSSVKKLCQLVKADLQENTNLSKQEDSSNQNLAADTGTLKSHHDPKIHGIVESEKSKILNKSIHKKNMGRERLENLRKSLELGKEHLEEIANVQRRQSLQNVVQKMSPVKQTNIYKDAEVRLTRLRNKLIRSKILMDKNTTDAQSDEHKKNRFATPTVDNLIKQSVDNSFSEEMEWEPMEDEDITSEVQEIRNKLGSDSKKNVPNRIPSDSLVCSLLPQEQEKQQIYAVIDTNVFLTNIQTVNLLRESNFTTFDRPIVVIPWTVIRELDYIKDNKGKKSSALCHKARIAVSYINKLFSSKDRIMGQTLEDVRRNKKKFAADCPDDEILQTCLQIRDLGKKVVLLSYDKNLCTKAMIHNIAALGRNDPIEKLDFLKSSTNMDDVQNFGTHNLLSDKDTISRTMEILQDFLNAIKVVLKEFLTEVVSVEMRELYGEHWQKYVIIPPPWTTETVLKTVLKHWIAATSEAFHRKAQNILQDLLRLFSDHSICERSVEDVCCILQNCWDVVQMVNTDKYSTLMIETGHKLDDLKQKLKQYQIELNEQRLRNSIGTENNVEQEYRRAEKAFRFFESAYAYARDICGYAFELLEMPCGIFYEKLNPQPPTEYVKKIQPDLAANVNKLLNVLNAVLEEAEEFRINERTLTNLHQILVTFLPDFLALSEDLSPLDVLCCVKYKTQVLKTGIRQLQELSTHFCRLETFKPT